MQFVKPKWGIGELIEENAENKGGMRKMREIRVGILRIQGWRYWESKWKLRNSS